MKEPNEELFVDLLEWLEKTGHEGTTKTVAQNIVAGRNSACAGFTYHVDRVESEGVLRVCFHFPLSRLTQFLDSDTELDELSDWFEAVNDTVVQLSIEEHKKHGKCITVHRLHYIPKNERGKWLGSSEVAAEEQEMLCRLIQRHKK